MAKQIKRFGLPILLIAVLAALYLVPFARSDPPQNPPSATAEQAQFGIAVRESIGFGPRDILPALSSNQQHSQMINSGLMFTANDNASLKPLIDAQWDAERQLVHALTWGVPAAELQAAYDQAAQARQAIYQASTSLVAELTTELPEADAAMINIVAANIDLDPELRTIVLRARQEIT